MASHRRFFLATTGLSTVLSFGAFTPFAVASPWPQDVSGASSLEMAAVPPPADDPARPDLAVERTLDGTGSVVEPPTAAADAPAVDPWAEAFAESSRLGGIVPPPPIPSYPPVVNPQVQRFIDRFTGPRRDVVSLWVSRAGRYLGMIRQVFQARGLPEELVYTAMIESGFNPRAVSRMGAKGLWQFMAGTARRYGLRVDQWVDERLDAEKSTVAAAAYLRDLHTLFGAWPLAQAAYNAGEVKVSRAIRATGSTDFWTLARTKHLKPETREFVPQIHAATLIGQDPARYGFEFTEPEPPAVEQVTVPPSTDLRRVAAGSGIPLETLRELNPVLVRADTPPGRSWQLTVPAGAPATVLAALAPRPPRRATAIARPPAVKTPRVAHRGGAGYHVVRPRDTVSAIAKQYGVSVGDLLRWNRLQEQARIRPGDRLRIADARPSAESDGQGGFR
jgi:membrane-bound lytic murein transglycosylase D